MHTQLQIQGGVLIIGSLLWQDHFDNKEKDGIRKQWRDERLFENQKVLVKVPIRYGRISKSDIYTMTFSNSCAKVKNGTGYFIPFKKEILKVDDIFKEAKATSIAEGMRGNFIARSQAGDAWCVLGILFNPELDLKIKKTILVEWKKVIDQEGQFYPNDFRLGRERPCIKVSGELNIKWPVVVDKRENEIFNKSDFIIATATRPTVKYPSIEELVNKINLDKSRYYFIENFKSGISTFQDNQVINKLF